VPPLSRRSALTGQPRSQRIRCLLGSSGTSRRSRRHTAELPRVPPLSRFPRRAFLNTATVATRPAQRMRTFPHTPRARATRLAANPRPTASPLPPPPFPPEPPFLRAPLSLLASGGTGSKNGPFHRAVFLGGSGDRILIAAVTLRASAVGAGPLAAAGYASRPEPRGPRFALPPARLSGRDACAGSPTRGSLRRQRRLGCHTIQRQRHRQCRRQLSRRQLQLSDPLGVATRPPASSFRARIQARRSRRLPPIPDAPHGHGLHASAAASQPYLHRTFR
jgi:hypothetical protein